MNATETTRIEIDDRIREQPALLQAAHEATTYLLGRIESVPPPAIIRWRFAPLNNNAIELSMSDSPDASAFVARRIIPLVHLNDPVSRDIGALWTCADLFAERSRVNGLRITQRLRELNWDDDFTESNAP